jgi:hypothetical protein
MKLKTHNPDSLPQGIYPKAPTISINAKKGQINFGVQAIRDMGLKTLDQVVFHQDETKPQDWYIEKVVCTSGYPLRYNSPKGNILSFGNRFLVHKILKSCNCSDLEGSHKLRIGSSVEHDGMTLWPIITAPIVNK